MKASILKKSLSRTTVTLHYSQGVTFVVAAGNKAANACYFSPASAYYAFTVGASDERDRFASFSNHGHCVSIIAPVRTLATQPIVCVLPTIHYFPRDHMLGS